MVGLYTYSISIKSFLDEIGRVKARPIHESKQSLVVSYLAQKIPLGRAFTEHQLTQLLSMRHTFGDAAMLHKELFAQQHVVANDNGMQYRPL